MGFLETQADIATLIGIVSAIVVPICGALIWVVKALMGKLTPAVENLSASVTALSTQAALDRQEAKHRGERVCEATEQNTVEIRRLVDRLSTQGGCSFSPVDADLAGRAHKAILKGSA